MPPGQHNILHAAATGVNAIFSAVNGVVEIRIVLEGVMVDYSWIVGATDRERITHYVPLAFGAVEEEKLA